jgi:hypothetical protein
VLDIRSHESQTSRSPVVPERRAAQWDRLGFVPGTVLRAFGMRRSGNHAIADWLLRNAPSQNSVFLNNCVARRNPLGHFRSISVNGRQQPGRAALKDLRSFAAAAGDGAVLLFSYEDNSPAEASLNRPISADFDETSIDADLVIYRGFLNWCASLTRKLQANPGYSLSRRASIVLHAIDTYTRMLGLVAARDELGLTPICYDDWSRSESYRGALLAGLGFPLRDNSLGRVQPYGGGSSFQKDATLPDDLATDRRWQQMADDPEFRAITFLAGRDMALTRALDQVLPQDAARLAMMPPLAGYPA